MPRFSLDGLRIRLFLLVLLAALPALALVLYSGLGHRNYAAAVAQENALQLARVAATSEDNLVEGARQLLTTLALFPQIIDGDSERCSEFVRSLLEQHPHYSAIIVAWPNGDVFCNSHPTDEPINLSDRVTFQRALAAGDFVTGDYTLGRISGRPVLPLAYPILDDNGPVQMVIGVGLELTWLSELADQLRMPDGTVLVVNSNGRVMARYPNPEQWAGLLMPRVPLIEYILAHRMEGTVQAAGVDGVERLYAFTPITGESDWPTYLAIGVPKPIAFAEADRTLLTSLLGLGLVTSLALAATWFFGDVFIVRQLNTLLDATRALAAGNLGARTGLTTHKGEVGQLALAFDEMAESLEAQISERIRAEETSHRHAAQAEALTRIAARLNAQLDLNTVLNLVCEETAQALGVAATAVILYDAKRNVFYYAATYGLPPGFRERTLPAPRQTHDEYTGRLGPVKWVPDVQILDDLANKDLYVEYNIRTAVAVDLTPVGQKLMGSMSLFTFDQVRSFTADEMALLKGLADQAALAIANARLFDKVNTSREQLRLLAQKLVTAQEEERQRLSRDLHDQTGQVLTALRINLGLIRVDVPPELMALQQRLDEAIGLADMVSDEIRSIAHALRPPALDKVGLNSTLETLCQEFGHYTRLGIAYTGVEVASLPDEIAISFYRFLQEALTNIAKHAQARQVNVTLSHTAHLVSLCVEDDGQGFQQIDSESTVGIGLVGLQERFEMLGGELEIASEPGQGTRLLAHVLWPEARDHSKSA